PDHDVLHISAINFGGATFSIAPGSPATIPGAFGTLTVDALGNYSYKATGAKSGQDIFTYIVDDGHEGHATSTLVVSVLPSEVVRNVSAGLQSASNIFQHNHGEIAVLASLAEAAYHLLPPPHRISGSRHKPSGFRRR